MFERFTDRARRMVVLAQEEARLLNHNYIGTEHMLLGMLANDEDPITGILTERGCGLDAARARVEEIIGMGQTTSFAHIPFTPRAKKVLEISLREALDLGDDHIGTGHVLLGLLREGDGVASQVISGLDVDQDALREQVLTSLRREDPEPLGRKRPPVRASELRSVLDEMQRRIEALEIRLTALEDRADP
ncbi:Clp protease N-terminal domain-containing protein [Actinocorallia longicatena]|uniref:Clp R domain-containing protein n=1 Tax=Actinocorallia longicatena TaxID=111803 RepID=A0ABP6QEF0_9ACTN